jgi:presenilin-like A22 family membrane protease
VCVVCVVKTRSMISCLVHDFRSGAETFDMLLSVAVSALRKERCCFLVLRNCFSIPFVKKTAGFHCVLIQCWSKFFKKSVGSQYVLVKFCRWLFINIQGLFSSLGVVFFLSVSFRQSFVVVVVVVVVCQ